MLCRQTANTFSFFLSSPMQQQQAIYLATKFFYLYCRFFPAHISFIFSSIFLTVVVSCREQKTPTLKRLYMKELHCIIWQVWSLRAGHILHRKAFGTGSDNVMQKLNGQEIENYIRINVGIFDNLWKNATAVSGANQELKRKKDRRKIYIISLFKKLRHFYLFNNIK